MLAKLFKSGKLLDIVRAHYDKMHVILLFLTFKYSSTSSHLAASTATPTACTLYEALLSLH